MKRLGLLAMVLALVLSGTAAWADGEFYVIAGGGGVGTKINSLPYTILAPGFYFLGGDLSASGKGITVNVDNVTIDLMGFSMTGNGTPEMSGIDITGRSNVEIRDGTVRNFGGGIYSVTAGKNCRILNIRAVGNVGHGIKLVGSNHLVQNCNASNNTGGDGIVQSGRGAMITGNICSGNEVNGIECSGGNLIANVVYGNKGNGFYLMYEVTSDYYMIDRNTVYGNTGGNLNGVPPKAYWGVNAGVPTP
jgi:hypothetical protein